MGDPAGIGPEIVLKALSLAEVYGLCRPLVVGEGGVLGRELNKLGLTLRLNPVQGPGQALFSPGTVDLLDLANLAPGEHRYKEATAAQGRASYEYVAKVIELALAGKIQGTVTGPITKAALNAAGIRYAGHTEIYADLTRTKDYAMMLAEGDFKVVHISTHVSLKEACDRVRKARVGRVIDLTAEALGRLGIERPRIGVAGLNPHCGEGGMFGTEDEEEIAPAVREARAKGTRVEGPIPADTIFSKMKGGMYDAVVVMYHDQGHIPTKLVGFVYDDRTGAWGTMAGVNVTLGLPIVRTSVDHGTAYGKAGEGRANPQSMIEAIRMAAVLAGG